MDERIREMKRRLDEGECSIDEYLTARLNGSWLNETLVKWELVK